MNRPRRRQRYERGARRFLDPDEHVIFGVNGSCGFGARILFVTERHLYYLRGSIWSTTNAKAVILKRPLGETPIEASERMASAPHGGGVRQGSVLIGNPKVGIESMRVPGSGLDELKRIVATNLVAAAERS
ncbi:MAG: hypothetical protein M3Z33_12545 [Actinomycetota bacterium]|nr:hypothetical protein [Actinomycetota bacterium]